MLFCDWPQSVQDEALKELEEMAQQGDWSVALCFVRVFPWLEDSNHTGLPPDFRKLGEGYAVVEQREQPFLCIVPKMFDLFCTYVIKTSCLAILKGVDSRLEFQVVKVPGRFCVNLWPRIPFVAFLVCRFSRSGGSTIARARSRARIRSRTRNCICAHARSAFNINLRTMDRAAGYLSLNSL